MLVPSLWKHPPISGLTTCLNPPFAGFSQAFPALETPPKSKTLLNVPPIIFNFLFYNPLFKFLRRPKRERKKNHPFLKEISGWNVKYPPFLQFSGRTLSHEKYPFTGDFGNTHAVPPTPEWGGGGGGRGLNADRLNVWTQILFILLIFYFENWERVLICLSIAGSRKLLTKSKRAQKYTERQKKLIISLEQRSLKSTASKSIIFRHR